MVCRDEAPCTVRGYDLRSLHRYCASVAASYGIVAKHIVGVYMQTFLPYPDFERSAAALDYRRLGKQRIEAYQILQTLQNPEQRSWRNHPAVRMWRG